MCNCKRGRTVDAGMRARGATRSASMRRAGQVKKTGATRRHANTEDLLKKFSGGESFAPSRSNAGASLHTGSQCGSMNTLPPEVWHLIFDLIEPSPLPLRLSVVSKRWAQLLACWRPRVLPVADVSLCAKFFALIKASSPLYDPVCPKSQFLF